MSSPRLQALRAEFDRCRSGIDQIESKATAEARDLSDTEQTDADALYARIDQITPDIESLADRERSLASTADVLARIAGTGTTVTRVAEREVETPTAGEWLARSIAAHDGDTEASAWLDDRCRALDLQTTGDNAGILPKPIVGEVLSIVDASRPVFGSFTSRDMPTEGRQFDRPRITVHTEIGEQANQGDELSSNKMTLVADTVTKRTIGGALEISRQDRDWTSPAALQVVVADFVDMYAVWTEGAACDALEAAITTNTSPWDDTSVGSVVSSIALGVQEVYDTSKRMPTTFWLGLTEALDLAAITNTDDSVTAIEMVKRALAAVGINLDFVVGPQLAEGTRILGNKLRVESYEQQLGLLSLDFPSRLKTELAYAGYLAFHLRPESVVGLVDES